MFTFLSPLFLVGLLSAAIPLIIHLSRSRRTKKMQFSTTRFFTDQFLRSYRMSRLKELLLLACRMALCALFAMALARPLIMPRGQTYLGGQSRAVVLVLDNSASMGYVEDGTALFDRARAAAVDLVNGLRPGDTAAVVLAGRRAAGPEVLFPQPTPELGEVLQTLQGLKAASLGTDLAGAVARAEELLQGSSAKNKEIYVLSDLQKSGWDGSTGDTALITDAEALLFFVRIRPRTVANAAITAVQYAASRPMVGVPFAIRPHVRIDGDRLQTCTVQLWVDGDKVNEKRLEKLQSGRWAVPRFYHTFATGGWHSGHVEVQDDTLAADNRRYFAFEVMDSIKLLAVNGAPSEVPRLDELFFLKTALTATVEGKSSIQVDDTNPAALADQNLGDYPLVILANVEALPAQAVLRLEHFVDGGGSLLIFLGDKVQSASYNQTLAAPTRLHGGLLPGKLLEIEGNAVKEKNLAFVSDVDYGHAALAMFQDPRFASLTGVNFKALWKVDPGNSSVLMRTNTGSPLLCEKAFGKGRVMLFTSTCDRDWTNFPVRPAYLPWLYRLVGYLAQEPLGRQAFYATGDRIPIPVSATGGITQVQVKKPKPDDAMGFATTSEDPNRPLEFTDTLQPGVYTLFTPEKKGPAGLFVANLESNESDLTYLDDELAERDDGRQYASREAKIEAGIRELLAGRPLVYYVDDPGQAADVALGARRGFKLWDILLVIVLGIALFEPWFANRISMRHYARPGAKPGALVVRGGRLSRLFRGRSTGAVVQERGQS